jgi:hypothetical protein
MGRKSQVEKFNRRQGKVKKDDAVIREAEAKQQNKSIGEKGANIMAKHTNNTEEVFAVIAQSGMEAFMRTWNNSMESVIRETIRTEVKALVQEELQSAMKGMFAGMNDAMKEMINPSAIQEKVEEAMTEQVEERIEMPLSQRVKKEKEEARKRASAENKDIPRSPGGRISWKTAESNNKSIHVLKSIVSQSKKLYPDVNLSNLPEIRKTQDSDLLGAYTYYARKRKDFPMTWGEFVSEVK